MSSLATTRKKAMISINNANLQTERGLYEDQIIEMAAQTRKRTIQIVSRETFILGAFRTDPYRSHS
jgi:hypothetical protein